MNALIAQIRAGLWVRNGLSIRAQQMHYRESGLRDYTLDQEIFMLQAALTIADPSAILITLLDRFEILSWLTDPTYPQEYELSQLFTLTEELLYLLTILLGEPANICCWSPQRVTRREVTQALALGPCSHSELVKRLPETTYDSHRLRQALQDVAHFRHPIGATDHGIYSLKTDVHQELDPFYYRYTRNQRDTCLGTIKECLPPNEQDDYVFLPPPLDITSHSFAQVLSSFESPVLTELLVQCLVRGASSLDQTTEVSDTFLDLTVHLIVLALVNAPQPFASIATRASSYSSSTTLISALHTAHVAATGSLKLRLQWCLRQLGQMPTPRTEQPASSAINSEAEAKKAAAKARQNAIMAQFADAQKAFLENIEDEEEDEGNDTVMGADGLDTATSSGSCIVCQEDLTTSTPYGALALIQASSLVREFDSSVPSTKSPLGLTPGFPSQARAGLHATSCGHLMHVTCFETYCQSIESRHSSNPNRHHPEDLNRREFICPLCKSLGNVMLPHLDAIDMTFIITERADASPLEMFNNSLNALQADINDADRFSGQVAPLLSRGDPQRVRAFSVRNSLPSAVVPTLQPVSSSQMRMIDRVMQVVQPLTMETHWNDSEGLQYYISEELIAYTLACIEIAGRQEGANEQPSYDDEQISKPLAVVKSLLSILPDLAAIGAGSLSGADDTLLAVIAGTLCPLQTSRNATSMASLIRKDPVTMLAESSSLAPQHFSALATFSFYAAIIRSVVALSSMSRQEISALGVGTSESSSPLSADLAEVGHNLASAFDLSFQVESEASSSTRPVLGCAIRRIVLPFLRRSLLLQKCLFESQNIGQSLSFEDMLGQLGIVPPSELQSQQAKALDGWMKEWGQAYMRALRNTSTDPQRVLEHLGPYTLVRLPHRLDQLIGRIKKVPCRRCGKSPADPAVCLLCGELLCAQSFCCMDNTLEEPMHGECNTHMWR